MKTTEMFLRIHPNLLKRSSDQVGIIKKKTLYLKYGSGRFSQPRETPKTTVSSIWSMRSVSTASRLLILEQIWDFG